jgi:hypothetical protein
MRAQSHPEDVKKILSAKEWHDIWGDIKVVREQHAPFGSITQNR